MILPVAVSWTSIRSLPTSLDELEAVLRDEYNTQANHKDNPTILSDPKCAVLGPWPLSLHEPSSVIEFQSFTVTFLLVNFMIFQIDTERAN